MGMTGRVALAWLGFRLLKASIFNIQRFKISTSAPQLLSVQSYNHLKAQITQRVKLMFKNLRKVLK
jgi:hypothetical protein